MQESVTRKMSSGTIPSRQLRCARLAGLRPVKEIVPGTNGADAIDRLRHVASRAAFDQMLAGKHAAAVAAFRQLCDEAVVTISPMAHRAFPPR